MEKIKECLNRKKKPNFSSLSLSEEKKDEKKEATDSWGVFKKLIPYLWPKNENLIKLFVIIALTLMSLSKASNIIAPMAYRNAIDILTTDTTIIQNQQKFDNITQYYNNNNNNNNNNDTYNNDNLNGYNDNFNDNSDDKIIFPAWWIISYFALSFFSSGFNQMRGIVFNYVIQFAIRATALKTFSHLHSLSLHFHTKRKTGAILRAVERGSQGIQYLLSNVLFHIGPTFIEIFIVCGILLYLYKFWFSLITALTMILYIVFTISVTQWRTKFRREMNDLNNESNNRAVDSLLNYETVKYFCNEEHEANRYSLSLMNYSKASIKSQNSIAFLNAGQAAIIAIGQLTELLLAAYYVTEGTMTVGDFVLVNTYLLQLYEPLDYLGSSYRMIKGALVDMESMFALIDESLDVQDAPDAKSIVMSRGKVEFQDVSFSYGEKDLQIFSDINFEVEEGKVLAIVGPTGSGKSTISKLLYRFYDVNSGSIKVDGEDVRDVTQYSLRKNIAIVPQDTVLFNDTIRYNIQYGNLDASDEEVERAAMLAKIHDFIITLPDGYNTIVGERGLRLSGGEKQRVAIARAILKNPRIMIFDEATSALDTKTEKEIQNSLNEISQGKTTIIVAHRLSTIMNADEIIVLKEGRIVERGSHQKLLSEGGEYFEMWQRQLEVNDSIFTLEEI